MWRMSLVGPALNSTINHETNKSTSNPQNQHLERSVPFASTVTCGALVGVSPEPQLAPLPRGAATAAGSHETYDPGHVSEVAWYLEGEAWAADADELQSRGPRKPR